MRIRRSFVWPFLLLPVLVAIAFPEIGARLFADSNTASRQREIATRIPAPTFSIMVGIDGEIFPVLANYASLHQPSQRDFGTFAVSITNPASSELQFRVSVQVPGWSDLEVQNASIPAQETRQLLFAPSFLPRFYANHEILAATAIVRISDRAGKLIHAETVPVRLRSTEDMYWGKGFNAAKFIASWVTPHDPKIEHILSRAKEFMHGRRLPGYEAWKSPQQQRAATYAQAKAIYRALQQSGVSYVKSSYTLGRNSDISERVRMPGRSILHSSANCIDGVVAYASLFENLGMDTEVVLVPGHAYVAVREAQGSKSYIYIETALTGRSSFEAALNAANKGMSKYRESDVIRISISQARAEGIYPMPLPAVNGHPGSVQEASLATKSASR